MKVSWLGAVMLRTREIRAVYRLLGEVRALGDDPLRWPFHALHGLRELMQSKIALCGVISLPTPTEPAKNEILHVVGLDDEKEIDRIFALNRDKGLRDPYGSRWFANRKPPRFSCCTRQEVLSDEDFYSDPGFELWYGSFGLDQLCSSQFIALSIGKMVGLMALRPTGAPAFNKRDKRLLTMFHIEMARMWKDDLATPDDFKVRDLAPRLREVLWMLCMGDSEKQIAGKLGLSQHTVHDYVKALHKHFQVNSRGALLSKVLRSPRRAIGQMRMPADGYHADRNSS